MNDSIIFKLFSDEAIIDKSYEIYFYYIAMAVFFIFIVMVLSLLVDDLLKIYNIWKTRLMVSVILGGICIFIEIGGMLNGY